MTHRSLLGLSALATVACALSAFGQAPPAIKTQNIATNLYLPTSVTHAPGDKCRLFVTEKRGTIKVLDISAPGVATPLGTFLDIDSLVISAASVSTEQGLLGLAFHPDYWNNGYFFVYYTNNSGSQVVARYKVGADPNVADPASALILLTMSDPFINHNGGWLEFGPDGYLYISCGDGGSANDPNANGQNINSKLGKLLRIAPNVTGDSPTYTNPSDNPFVGVTGDDSIWAYGLRNPWRCSFDRLTGDLYIGDVGQDAHEEIDFQLAGVAGGRNYGWRCMEGIACTGLSGCTCNGPTLTLPIKDYPQVGGTSGGNCVIGGRVYRGCALPAMDGFYIHGDYVNNNVWAMRVSPAGVVSDWTVLNSQVTPSLQGTTVNSIVAFGQDANGEIYIVKHSGTTTGGIFKIVPPTGDAPCGIPGDFNLDGVVDGDDLGHLLGEWDGIGGDLNCDHITDGDDLGTLLGNWTP